MADATQALQQNVLAALNKLTLVGGAAVASGAQAESVSGRAT